MRRPLEIKKIDEITLGITWDDHHQSVYDTTFLREECPCAGCVDEWSGKKILQRGQLPKIVKPANIDSVGQYGLKIQFSDGHSTGIYTFDNLRRLCQCSSCKK